MATADKEEQPEVSALADAPVPPSQTEAEGQPIEPAQNIAAAIQPLEQKETNQDATPKSLDTVKQMFDSATLLRMENENPFKGNKDLNRTKNNRFVPRSNGRPAPTRSFPVNNLADISKNQRKNDNPAIHIETQD